MSETTEMEYKAGLSEKDVRAMTQGAPVTKLSSNENPFGPSPKAVAAAQAALEGANSYPERDDAALCEELATFHGRGLAPDNFFAANSGVEVLSLIEDTCLMPGSRAIICPPCFGAYGASLKTKDAVIDRVPLIGLNYDVDVARVLNAVSSETRLVYLCNPNNPTGTWFGEDVLSAVLNGLPGHVTLIYDEVYYQFATETGLPDAIRHVLEGRNIAIVHSFSKAYGLAGMRLGYGIAPAELAARVQKRKRAFHINAAGMAAAAAALGDTKHLNRTVRNNHSERQRLTEALTAHGLEIAPSQANFVMFRCPDRHDAKSMTAALVGQGIMVRPAFDLPHHIRLTVGTPEDNTRFLSALDEILRHET